MSICNVNLLLLCTKNFFLLKSVLLTFLMFVRVEIYFIQCNSNVNNKRLAFEIECYVIFCSPFNVYWHPLKSWFLCQRICSMLTSMLAWHLRKSLYKSLSNSAWLWNRARITINKKKKYFSSADHRFG